MLLFFRNKLGCFLKKEGAYKTIHRDKEFNLNKDFRRLFLTVILL